MKHIKHLLFLSILCSLVLFTNCGDSDDPVADGGSFIGLIGDPYQGGIVFYLDGNGKGLIAATGDQTTEDGAEWGCYETELSGAGGTAIGKGGQNTLDILDGCSENGIAAKLSADYEVTEDGVTYDDWFLPSKDELNELYFNKATVGGFANGDYWSSTEFDFHTAWAQSFVNGSQLDYGKLGTHRVRSVRAF